MDSNTKIEVLPNDIKLEIYNQAYLKDNVLPSRRNWAFTNQFYNKLFRPNNLLDIPKVIRLDTDHFFYENRIRILKSDFIEKVLSYPQHINTIELKYVSILSSSKEKLLNKHKIKHLDIEYSDLTVALFVRFHNWGSSIKSLSLNHVFILPIDDQNNCKTLQYQQKKIRKIFNKENLCHSDTLAFIFSCLTLKPSLETLYCRQMELSPRALDYISKIKTLKTLKIDKCSFSLIDPLANLLPLIGNLEELSMDLDGIDLFSLFALLDILSKSPIKRLTLKNVYFENLENLDLDLAYTLHENFFKASNHLELININFDLAYLNEIIAEDFVCTRLTLTDTYISEDILEYIVSNSRIQTIIGKSDYMIGQINENHQYLEELPPCLSSVLKSQAGEIIFDSVLNLESLAHLSDINTQRLIIANSYYTDYLSLFNNLYSLNQTESLAIEMDDAMILPSINIMLSLFLFQSPSLLKFLYIKTSKEELQNYIAKLKLFKSLFPEYFSFSFHGDYISISKPEVQTFSPIRNISWNDSETLIIKLQNNTRASDLLYFLNFISKTDIPKVTIENFQFKSNLFTNKEIAPLYTHLFNLSRNIDIDCEFNIFEAVQALNSFNQNENTDFICTNIRFKTPQKDPESILELINMINPNTVSYNFKKKKTSQYKDPYEELSHLSGLALLESRVECASIYPIENLRSSLIKPILVKNLKLTKTKELQLEMIKGVFHPDSTIENLDIYFEKGITIDEVNYFIQTFNKAFMLNKNKFLEVISLHYTQPSFNNYVSLKKFMASTTYCQAYIEQTGGFFTLIFNRIHEPRLLPVINNINTPNRQQKNLSYLTFKFENLKI